MTASRSSDGDNDPGNEFEAFETQMVPIRTRHAIHAAVEPQHCSGSSSRTGCLKSATSEPRAQSCCRSSTPTRPLDIDTVGFLPRPGVPGGGFTGNYYEWMTTTASSTSISHPCDVSDDPGDCRHLRRAARAAAGPRRGRRRQHVALQRQLDLPFAADGPDQAFQQGVHVQRQLHVLALDRYVLR